MKTRMIVGGALLFALLSARSATTNKLWVSREYDESTSNSSTDFYFIQDKETGTRCYSVVIFGGVGTSSSISCVEKH